MPRAGRRSPVPPRFLASHLPGGGGEGSGGRLRERPRLAEAGVVAEADRLRTRNGPGRGSGAGCGPRGNGPGGRWGLRRSSGRRGAFLLQEPKRGSRRGTALTVPLRSPLVGCVSGAAALKPRGAGFPCLRPVRPCREARLAAKQPPPSWGKFPSCLAPPSRLSLVVRLQRYIFFFRLALHA